MCYFPQKYIGLILGILYSTIYHSHDLDHVKSATSISQDIFGNHDIFFLFSNVFQHGKLKTTRFFHSKNCIRVGNKMTETGPDGHAGHLPTGG